MKNQLYIPKRINVGYQKRDDTYTKKLAYVTYFDDKGVLRKQKSWDQWRDHEIENEEFENKPQSGFVLNKNVERYNWGHFGSGRSMIRIYDPRGIEFEITTENLIGILMCTNCSKRGLDNKFVYAWCGTELLLLPTNTEEYTKAIEYTSLQSGKISAKNLVPGCPYITKKQEDLIYLGRYMWHEFKRNNNWNCERVSKKKYIFINDKHFVALPPKQQQDLVAFNDISCLASQTSETPVSNFAGLVDKFKKDIRFHLIQKYISKPLTQECLKEKLINLKENETIWIQSLYASKFLNCYQSNECIQHFIRHELRYDGEKRVKTNKFSLSGSSYLFNLENGQLTYMNNYSHSYLSHSLSELIQILKNPIEIYAVLENNDELRIKDVTNLERSYYEEEFKNI